MSIESGKEQKPDLSFAEQEALERKQAGVKKERPERINGNEPWEGKTEEDLQKMPKIFRAIKDQYQEVGFFNLPSLEWVGKLNEAINSNNKEEIKKLISEQKDESFLASKKTERGGRNMTGPIAKAIADLGRTDIIKYLNEDPELKRFTNEAVERAKDKKEWNSPVSKIKRGIERKLGI